MQIYALEGIPGENQASIEFLLPILIFNALGQVGSRPGTDKARKMQALVAANTTASRMCSIWAYHMR